MWWTPQDLPEEALTMETPTWTDPWAGNRDTDKYWAKEA